MTTLAELRADIVDESGRDDWNETTDLDGATPPLDRAVKRAIRKFDGKPFYFNFARDDTFETVAGQAWYGSTDAAFIPDYFLLRHVFARLSGQTSENELSRSPYEVMSLAIAQSSQNSEPRQYTYQGQEIALFAVPTAGTRIRLEGFRKIAAPESDAETGNLWMTEAYDLIRHEALATLYAIYAEDPQHGATHMAYARECLSMLNAETDRRHSTGRFTPTEF